MKDFLEKYYRKDEEIVLGCSGWPDSMYLLYRILDTEFRKNLVVCYFNHKTRPETEVEEKYLENFCKKENIKFETAFCDFEKIQKLYQSKSFEELAREKRYQFFEAICNIYKVDKVITAHHLDDKIETFFFNLARWSKITGLINMTEKSWPILRPLLNIEKKEILKYLDENKLKYFTDETNFDTKITRNKLRQDIIPEFESVNSNYKKNISNFQNYLEEVKDFIDDEIEKFLNEQWVLIFNSWKYKINTLEIYGYFYIKDFLEKSAFFQKELIRHVFYTTNNKSTIGLSESNIKEVIKYINWKNNKTIKDIRNMKLKKENEIIIF